MAKRKEVAEIGKRAAQEVLMIWDTFADVTRAIGCSMNAIYAWNHGRAAPNSVLLAKLYDYRDCSVNFTAMIEGQLSKQIAKELLKNGAIRMEQRRSMDFVEYTATVKVVMPWEAGAIIHKHFPDGDAHKY